MRKAYENFGPCHVVGGLALSRRFGLAGLWTSPRREESSLGAGTNHQQRGWRRPFYIYARRCGIGAATPKGALGTIGRRQLIGVPPLC